MEIQFPNENCITVVCQDLHIHQLRRPHKKSNRYFKTDCKFLLIYEISVWCLAVLTCVLFFFFPLEWSSGTFYWQQWEIVRYHSEVILDIYAIVEFCRWYEFWKFRFPCWTKAQRASQHMLQGKFFTYMDHLPNVVSLP